MDKLKEAEAKNLLHPATLHLNWPDFVVIGVYFAAILGVGIYASFRRNASEQETHGYFLASRKMNWLLVGGSLFASNIGSEHFIGLAGSGAASGIGVAGFELNAIFILILLGWVFVPVYLTSGVYTMPEYLKLRFGGTRIQMYMAGLSLIIYIFTKISSDIYAGALFIQLSLGFKGDGGLYISIIIVLTLAAIFTIVGGLTAVMWTDLLQTILMILGAFTLMLLSFHAVGGYGELIHRYENAKPSILAAIDKATNESCGKIPEDAMHLFRAIEPGKSDLPWTGLVFGITISSIWFWCMDQVIVQRVLSSKNTLHSKGGCIFAGVLKLTPLFFIVFPGMAARVLYPERVGCGSPESCQQVCGSTSGCTNIAYAELVIRLMPTETCLCDAIFVLGTSETGLAGMMVAVMMGALMCSLTCIFNSSSTIFSMDIWRHFRRNASPKELVIVGRISVVVLLVVSVLWIPILKEMNAAQLFIYIQQVSTHLSPPVTAVFLLAIFAPRTTEPGAFWGLMLGLGLGIFRFVLELWHQSPSCGSDFEDSRPDWVTWFLFNIHYLHYGCILFLITLFITLIVSAFTEPISHEKLKGLTFWTREHRVDQSSEVEDNQGQIDVSNDHFKKNRLRRAESSNIEPKTSIFWNRFVNTSAVLLSLVTIFVYAYYA